MRGGLRSSVENERRQATAHCGFTWIERGPDEQLLDQAQG